MASSVTTPDETENAYLTVRADDNNTIWLALQYADDEKSIVFHSTGEDYGDFVELCLEDKRVYGYVKLITGDEMSQRAKFALITFIGQAVPPLKKAKVSTDKAFVKSIIKEFAKEFLVETKAELKYETLLEEVKKSGGANYGSQK